MKKYILFSFIFLFQWSYSQSILDNFEGSGTTTTWVGDNCQIDTSFTNPVATGSNTSSKVLKYHDVGGQYANVRFDVGRNLNLTCNSKFSVQIYVPSSGITGTQNNQISLKLQNNNSATPWTTQCEIIKNISLNQWQTVTFDFSSDPYINISSSSPAPTLRSDFNRILLQVNGENNTDQVLAYIDDFSYYDTNSINFNQLVWSDEFNGTGALTSSNWFHQTQLPISGSWYNGEIQHYTNRTVNSSMAGGTLNLIAKRESYSDQGHTKQFTSARLNSKFAFKYGRVVIRAKLPTGVGTWPAMWMLGKNITETGAYFQTQGFGTTSWPACGEIDIMEHWGTNQNFVQSAMHTPSSHGATVNHGGQTIPTASSAFHTYELVWTKDKMIFSVDSVVHYIYNPTLKNASTWPFDAEQYLIFNIAIQSSIAASFTQDTLLVDYVRIYQEGTTSLKEIETSQSHRFYPNPVTNQLTIDLEKESPQKVSLDLYAIEGSLIRSYEVSPVNHKLTLNDLNSLPNGLYLLSYRLNGNNYSIKFVKQ